MTVLSPYIYIGAFAAVHDYLTILDCSNTNASALCIRSAFTDLQLDYATYCPYFCIDIFNEQLLPHA